jgi:hypothetical protein
MMKMCVRCGYMYLDDTSLELCLFDDCALVNFPEGKK